MKRILIPVAIISAAVLPAPAPAEPASSAPSITVQYRDLDLNTPAGRATLRGRVNAAARKVCQTPFDGGVAQILGRPICLSETKAAGNERANMIIARAKRNAEGLLAAR